MRESGGIGLAPIPHVAGLKEFGWKINALHNVRNGQGIPVRLGFALARGGQRRAQMIRGPFRSVAGLAPTCSTRRCQFDPR
jgi:hypothetical protein